MVFESSLNGFFTAGFAGYSDLPGDHAAAGKMQVKAKNIRDGN